MSSFQVGDEVQLKDPKRYTYRGSNHNNLAKRIGNNIGVVTHNHGDTLNVNWNVPLLGSEGPNWGIDATSVMAAGPTEAELDEVYKILGVDHA